MTSSSTDRIDKQIPLRAPVSRVWQALTDARQFGAWFGVTLEGDFVVGRVTKGRITIPGFEHVVFEALIEKIEPEHHFAYRWHPYAVDPQVDYSQEPMTLVEFRLEATAEGTLLTASESGFDALSAQRRAEAIPMNTQGWEAQLQNIRGHVEKA